MFKIYKCIALFLVSAALLIAGPQPATAKDQVVLGAIASVTGTNANLGQDMERGIRLAIQRVNKGYAVPCGQSNTRTLGPGLLGSKVKVIVENTESRPQSAMDGVRKLVNVNKVPVVIGEFSSGITVPTGQFTNGNEVVQISVGATSPKLRDIGPYFFNAIGLDDLAGEAVARFALEDSGAKTYGSIVPNNPFGVGVEINTCKTVEQAGAQCQSKVRYKLKQSDYRAEVNSVFARNPEAVFYTAYGTEARLIFRQAFEQGKTPPKGWYAPYMTMWTNEVAEMPQIAEGVKGIMVGVSGDFYEKTYAQPYERTFGLAPTTAFGAYAYDATMLACLAIDRAGSTDPDKVAEALYTVSKEYRGVTGDKTFDADGMQMKESYRRKIYTDGKLVDYPVQ
jgi:branched-chain amino acid transport system substrate-binding protein